MDWLLQQTTTGSTYLQVVILLTLAVFVVLPLGYITIRDWVRAIKTFLKEEANVPRD